MQLIISKTIYNGWHRSFPTAMIQKIYTILSTDRRESTLKLYLIMFLFYSISVHKVQEIFIIMNWMLSVRVKEFSFHLFVKVYHYPVSTRKFHGSSVDHKRFGILVYFNGRQLITSIYTRKASFSKRIFRKDLS